MPVSALLPWRPPRALGPNTGSSALIHDRPDPGAARPSSPKHPPAEAPVQALGIPTQTVQTCSPDLAPQAPNPHPPPPKRAQVQ